MPNFEEELRKEKQSAKEFEALIATPTKFSESKTAQTAKKVSADVTKQTKKIVTEAVKVSKKSAPIATELWKKTTAQIKKTFSGKKWATGNKKVVILAAASVAVLALAITALVRLEVVTVTKGIPLTSGKSTGTSVMIDKFADVKRGDVIVGVLPGTKKEDKKTIMGSVFSQNVQTYALFDGEVIWQLPLKDLVGKALFVEPKRKI